MRKRNSVKTGYLSLVLVLLFVVLMLFGMFRSDYRTYHARMHGAPVWGRIIRVDDHVGQNGGYLKCRVEYAIGDESYYCYTGELPKRFPFEPFCLAAVFHLSALFTKFATIITTPYEYHT